MVKEKSHEMQCVVQNALPGSRLLVTQELSPYDLNTKVVSLSGISRPPHADHPMWLIQLRHLKIIE
jgi:hypothetical protein